MSQHTAATGSRRIMEEAASAFAAGNWQQCTRLIDAYRDRIWRRTVAAASRPPAGEERSGRRLRMEQAEALWQAMPAEVKARIDPAPEGERQPGLQPLPVAGYTEEGGACVALADYAAAMGVSPQQAATALADSGRLVPRDRVLSIH